VKGQIATFFAGTTNGASGRSIRAIILKIEPCKSERAPKPAPLANCGESQNRQLPVALSTEMETPGPIDELSETFFM